VAGIAILALAAIAGTILYKQMPTRFPGLRTPDEERKYIQSMPPEVSIQYFHQRLLPGIEYYEQAEFQSRRDKVYIGLAVLAGIGVIGLILVAIGAAGIVLRR
jgi:hypothetical protein